MKANMREFIYWAAIVLGLACAVATLFGLITPEQAKDAVIVLAIVYGAVAGLAIKNITPDAPDDDTE